ncbi:MAG: hypothetical protein EOO52_18250 [Gammaproteobacteria bacterium]|nr:MAG: hypothetical protein EOO52_18250 [Gammaproteobacteria bacterium]
MRSVSFIAFISVCIIFSNIASAEEQPEKLNATEINAIRNVSQSLLKVRGQERERIEKEIKPFRDDINEVKKALAESINEPNMITNFTNGNVVVTSTGINANQASWSWFGLWKRVTNIWQQKRTWFGSTDIISSKEQKTAKSSESLRRAKHIISDRRSRIETQLPSFWELWKTPDEHLMRSRDALTSLESKLQSIDSGDLEVRDKKIKEFIVQLDTEYSAVHGRQDPTITSITKHLSE